MTSAAFSRVLQATGYLGDANCPAPGLTLAADATAARLRTVFRDNRVGLNADAVFSAQNTPTSIFKDAGHAEPSAEDLKAWHEAAWNIGVAPLLWVITPTTVRLYDCYASPAATGQAGAAAAPALDQFALDGNDRLEALDAACGRLATESGAFWSSTIGAKIDRRHRVDRELLAEISALEDRLARLTPIASDQGRQLALDLAQRFIGRCIFTWYLLDRGLAQPFLPADLPADLSGMFETPDTAFKLFDWLRATFNGDLFPMDDPGAERDYLTAAHLALIRDFVEGRSLLAGQNGQGRLFNFRFNAIPVDLISSIYQQFARSSAADEADAQGLHYTPVELVHLTLDPVFEGLAADSRVVDPACGSGAFLVEAFRRLVWKACGDQPASRRVVRDILYGQLFGVDVNRSALGIAAFSLYLAALELDQEPILDIADLKFHRLIDETLFEADALGESLPATLLEKPYDVVVGNPPWTFVGQAGASSRRRKGDQKSLRPRRSPDQAFLRLAARLAGDTGRIAMVMKATPFFSKDIHAVEARSDALKQLAPVALINLSYLRREELFPDAVGPAILFFSRCALANDPDRMLVGSIPWTPDFRRTGVFQIGPGEIRSVPLDRVLRTPPFLKAATFGTVRDSWLIERLEKDFPTFASVLDGLGRTEPDYRGQGFQVKGDSNTPPAAFARLKVVTPGVFTPFRLHEEMLPPFNHETLHRPRREGIFQGPLLLCAKVGNDTGAQRGRYSAAVHDDSVLYTQNFYGVSFRDADARLAHVLSGILNSSLTAFQLALGGPTWGLERPTVEPHDLLSLRIPALGNLDADLLEAVIDAEAAAACNPSDPDRLQALDEAVYNLYELEPEERVLAAGSVERARHMIFENRKARYGLVAPPDSAAITQYAAQVAATVNAYLRAKGERHIQPVIFEQPIQRADWGGGIPGVTAVRFVMAPGRVPDSPYVQSGADTDMVALAGLLRGAFTSETPPYLNERRELRIYGEKDLYILKPTEIRYWSATTGLNDADIILADHWLRGQDVVFRA